MVQIPVGEWMPDTPDLSSSGVITAKNVIPGIVAGTPSYRPLPALLNYSGNALNARCQGAWYGQASDGSARVFFGTASKLYTLSGVTLVDVSKVGGYSTASDGYWKFEQFGDLLVATNGVDAPQKFTLTAVIDGSVKFANLGGSPPSYQYVAVVKDFLFFAQALSTKWSDIDNAESYTGGQSDSQAIPDGGLIHGVVGGEMGLLLQTDALRRLTPAGPPTFIDFAKIASNLGATLAGSVAAYSNLTFFCHRSGFYQVSNWQDVTPIGTDKVNKFFWDNLDQTHVERVSSCISFVQECYLISFPTRSASAGTPNAWLIYRYTTGKWSYAEPGQHEIIFRGASQTSYDLDTDMSTEDQNLDSVLLPSLDSEIYTGTVRPAIGATDTSHYFALANGSPLEGQIGTAEACLAPGHKSQIFAARPMVDGGSPTVTIGTRNSQADSVSWGTAQAMSSATGLCRFRRGTKARYHRALITIPAGSMWTHIMGLDDIRATKAGER